MPTAIAEDRPVRWGICATGNIARKFVTGLTEVSDAEVLAVGSRSQEGADTFADEFGIERRYASYAELAADGDVDVVYVSTPQNRHCEDVVDFLEAGRSVLCEKPFAHNRAESQRMVDAARAHDLLLMEALWSRFLPCYRSLVATIASGAIGEPRLLEADFGFRIPDIDPNHRLFDLERAGGGILDLGVYPVQLAHLLFGSPDRIGAVADMGSTGVDEQAAWVMGHGEGQISVLHTSIRTSTYSHAVIHGTSGRIKVDAMMHAPQRYSIDRFDGGADEVVEAPMVGNGLHYQAEEVHRCLRAGAAESDVMPLSETLSIMGSLDRIRAEVGIVYPGETSANHP